MIRGNNGKEKQEKACGRRTPTFMSQEDIAAGRKSHWQELEITGMVRNISPSVWRLKHLTALYMSENSLVCLPAEIVNLTQLTYLDLSNNKLRQIPAELGDLVNMRELHLNHNLLRLLPYELGKLFNLQVLGLKGNPLAADILSVYQEANGTQRLLTMMLNSLEGKLPTTTLGKFACAEEPTSSESEVAADGSSGSDPAELSQVIPRIIKPRKRRKKEKKPKIPRMAAAAEERSGAVVPAGRWERRPSSLGTDTQSSSESALSAFGSEWYLPGEQLDALCAELTAFRLRRQLTPPELALTPPDSPGAAAASWRQLGGLRRSRSEPAQRAPLDDRRAFSCPSSLEFREAPPDIAVLRNKDRYDSYAAPLSHDTRRGVTAGDAAAQIYADLG
ncbi:CCR4-NOT transcription complex subunit 6 [Amphibalanus amphitrite]|uniref:CCR4-NOT transcription complex subunit 6 n=1 Tax=Amphibalanus amphitrite TaxID=1232801 RepID=A0A6A4X083_AMPAM|nr:CCR4-NOT transcription complex subunit 6 [Amphibalanus amphitrite]